MPSAAPTVAASQLASASTPSPPGQLPTSLNGPLAWLTPILPTAAPKPDGRPVPVESVSGRRGYVKRNSQKALRRLRSILEENRDRGRRATVGGLDA